MIKKLTLILVLLYFNCPAQSDSVLINVNQTVEDLLGEPDEESDVSDIYEEIEYYILNPVDLNEADVKDLLKIPYIELSAAHLIVAHRKAYGTYFSENELYSVKGLPPSLVRKILPFLTCVKSVSGEINCIQPTPVVFTLRNRIIKDFQIRNGFRKHIYEGSPLKLYNRLKFEFGRSLTAGFVTEKDAGEKSYYDFLSGYIDLKDTYGIKHLLIGDYKIHFGQGLALWNSYGVSRGSDAVYSIKKMDDPIRPSTSASESNFLRGAAFQYIWEHAGVTGFYSRSNLDASLDSASGSIISLSMDGLHRTENEKLKKNAVKESVSGVILDYTVTSSFSASFLYYKIALDHTFKPSEIDYINRDNLNYYSGYIDLYINSLNIYGELSYSGNSSLAYLCGLRLSPSTVFSYSLLIRNYPADYTALHGSGFGERMGAGGNEFGIYNGFRWRTSIGTLNFYYDQFKFPFATFSNPLPSEGNELMLNYTFTPISKFEVGMKFKSGNKETAAMIQGEEKMIRRLKQSYRLEYSYTLSPMLRIKSRLEYVTVLLKDPHSIEEGYLFYQDIRIMPVNDLLLYSRIIFFRTNSFNSAIYEYENDLAGVLGSVGLYGNGIRFYTVVRYSLSGVLSLSLKYSETFKPGETSLGSGYQQIDGDLDNRISLQADINF